MSVQLDWQQEVGEEGWPRRDDGLPEPSGLPRWTRWLLIVLAVMILGGGLALWQRSRDGLNAAKADVQETVELLHWSLQQGDRDLFRRSLDPAALPWQSQVLADWEDLTNWASLAPAPQVQDLRLDGEQAQGIIRWQDPAMDTGYLARGWFRLVQGEWVWTQPRADRWGGERKEELPHVVLTFRAGDGELVDPILPALDAFAALSCHRYGVHDDDCHFHLRWDLLHDDGMPIWLQDLPLPPLASATADQQDGPLYLLGADDDAWHSRSLRERMLRFHPGRAFVSQSRLAVIRPAKANRLPDGLPGQATQPILLPSPWLLGVDEHNRPHPQWQAHAQRVIADAAMRRAQGVIVGAADYINAAWALHQALLAMDHDLPRLARWPQPGPTAPGSRVPLDIPDLTSLGAALQSAPDELALDQLADLVRNLEAHWSREELDDLAKGLGEEAFTYVLLQRALGVDEEAFLDQWRQERWGMDSRPMAQLALELE